jgi:hypothetical protein
MDKTKIAQLCNQIIAAANNVEHRGEQNSAQLMGICRAARQIAAELNRTEENQN